MSTKSISESTLAELMEKKEKHKFCIKLIDAEIAKREGKTIKIKKVSPESSTQVKKVSPKKGSTKTATRDDMKAVLKRKGIDFKESANKAELQEIVRKNNLVRIVENYHKERV